MIDEAPPVLEIAARAMPSGSNPAFSQKDLSSIAVVASTRMPGIWSNSTTCRFSCANVASWTLPVRS